MTVSRASTGATPATLQKMSETVFTSFGVVLLKMTTTVQVAAASRTNESPRSEPPQIA